MMVVDLFAGKMKRCNKCGETRPLDDFHNDRRRPDGKVVMCKPCRVEYRKRKYHEDPERAKSYALRWKRSNREAWKDSAAKSRHGVPRGTYASILEAQHGGCAICGDPPPDSRRHHIDHDHETGQIRSILCDRCNRAIGLLRDDPLIASEAARYLRWWKR